MGRNGKSLMGIPYEWELVTKLGMGMGRNGNRLHGNGREWECKKPFPGISTSNVTDALQFRNNEHVTARNRLLTLLLSTVFGLGRFSHGYGPFVLGLSPFGFLCGPFWTCPQFVGRFGLGRFGVGPFWYRPPAI